MICRALIRSLRGLPRSLGSPGQHHKVQAIPYVRETTPETSSLTLTGFYRIKRRGNRKGFTLVEILVALVLFSLIFLPLTSLFVAESKFEKKRGQKMTAMLVAKNELEKQKKTNGKNENGDYQVDMAGQHWNVYRTVETGEGAVVDTTTAIKKVIVTVRVTAERDTSTLAEFSVMRETYR